MIGVLGGTFDPIHFGHLRPALEVMEALGLTEVRFIPLGVPPHRNPPCTRPEQRLAMVRAAIAQQPGFVADDRELRRGGPSYTYDTLCGLREELGWTLPLCLLLGADAFAEFSTWHRPADILDLAHLLVMQRPGSRPPADPTLARWIAERATDQPTELRTAPGGRIIFQRVTQLDITATAIRAAVSGDRSARYLLPEAVREYIRKQRLYRD